MIGSWLWSERGSLCPWCEWDTRFHNSRSITCGCKWMHTCIIRARYCTGMHNTYLMQDRILNYVSQQSERSETSYSTKGFTVFMSTVSKLQFSPFGYRILKINCWQCAFFLSVYSIDCKGFTVLYCTVQNWRTRAFWHRTLYETLP